MRAWIKVLMESRLYWDRSLRERLAHVQLMMYLYGRVE
jgi:hypothetical protein